jgi:hypothetical protein
LRQRRVNWGAVSAQSAVQREVVAGADQERYSGVDVGPRRIRSARSSAWGYARTGTIA